MEINYKFIEEKVFKKEFGDMEIIIEEFHNYILAGSTPTKILYLLYSCELNSDEIAKLLPELDINSIRVTISRLIKELKIKKTNTKNKLNNYTLSKKGLIELNHISLDYSRTSEYVQFNKTEVNPENKELIKRFSNYIADNLSTEIKKYSNGEINYLNISVIELSEYDYRLADEVLDNPTESIQLIKTCLKYDYLNELELPEEDIQIRFFDLPSSNRVFIGDRRTKHLGTLVQMTGIIKRKTTINPRITYLEYLCTNPSCSCNLNKMKIYQEEQNLKELKMCPKCRSNVELINTKKDDYQYILLEEDISVRDSVDSATAKIKLVLLNGLTTPLNDKKNSVGTKITVNGILKDEKIIKGKSSAIETTFYLEINNLINTTELSEIQLSKQDIQAIEEFGRSPDCFEKLKKDFMPTIQGYEELKEVLLLQQFGGCEFGTKRNDTHILMIGDPGVGKSDIIKQNSQYAPKSIYASGKSSSTAGLTASVVKDELTGEYAVEAGAAALANGGLFCCDEVDKMGKDDTSAMHESLEQQTITINKAGKAILQSKYSALFGANPLKSKFDDKLTIDQQVTFEPSLLSRFDIIAILKDTPCVERDTEIAKGILGQYNDEEFVKDYMPPKFYKKFIYYVKNHKKHIMTEEINNFLTSEYVRRRKNYNPQETKFIFGTRQLEGWVRLTFAVAKANFAEKLEIEHAKKAISIMDYFNKELGFANIQAIDRVSTDLQYIDTTAQYQIKEIIKNNSKNGEPTSYQEFKKIFKDEKKLNSNLKKLIFEGSIFEPRKGLYNLVGGYIK